MKQLTKKLWMLLALPMLLGMTGCTSEDNPSPDDIKVLEESLVGLWYEEFVGEYSAEVTKELGVTNHEVSALTFFLKIINWMTANYK